MKRLIFTLLYCDGYFVLSRNFRLQKVGNIDWLFSNYKFNLVSRSLDEIMIIDISRKNRNTINFTNAIKEIAKKCFVPITVGGGISNMEIAKIYMNSGADKLLVNTVIYKNIDLIKELVDTYGKQCILGCVDFRLRNKHMSNELEIYVNNGQEIINIEFYKWLSYLEKNNIGEIVLQSIDNDGTGIGLFKNLDQKFLSKISVPLIFMGGIGNYEQIYEGFNKNYINAVSTANILNFIGDSFFKNRNYLIEQGIDLPNWNFNDFDKLENILYEI